MLYSCFVFVFINLEINFLEFFCFQRVILPPCGKEGRAKTTVPDSLGDHGIKIYSSEDMKTALQILANKYKWMNEWK